MNEWHEITDKRPPQNRVLLWAAYSPMKDGTWDFRGYSVGVYRFGIVRVGGGGFFLPERGHKTGPFDMRRFWCDIPSKPHECEPYTDARLREWKR